MVLGDEVWDKFWTWRLTLLDPNGLKLPQTGFLLGAQSIQSPDVSICWVHYPSLQSKSRDFVVQSSTCLNSTSKFPILFWLHNFHGSQTFWVKTPSFQHLVSPFPKPGGTSAARTAGPRWPLWRTARRRGAGLKPHGLRGHRGRGVLPGGDLGKCGVWRCHQWKLEGSLGWTTTVHIYHYLFLSLRRFGAYLFVEERDSTIHTTKSYGLWSISPSRRHFCMGVLAKPRIDWKTWTKLKRPAGPLLPFCETKLSSPGVMLSGVVTCFRLEFCGNLCYLIFGWYLGRDWLKPVVPYLGGANS